MPHYWVRIPSGADTGDDVGGHMHVAPEGQTEALQARERQIANAVFDGGGGYERVYIADDAEYVLIHERPRMDIDAIVNSLGADSNPLYLDEIGERIARG